MNGKYCSENKLNININKILTTGVIPDSWTNGIILSLFRQKGSRSNVYNYRGITIMRCLGKLFTSIINIRLTKFVENFNLIGFELAGLRKGFSTTDHLLTLKSLLHLYMSKKYCFCAFIEYIKAFDSVDRVCLWKTYLSLLVFPVKCLMLYSTCIHMQNHMFVLIQYGIRQGENLSPLRIVLVVTILSLPIHHEG